MELSLETKPINQSKSGFPIFDNHSEYIMMPQQFHDEINDLYLRKFKEKYSKIYKNCKL